MHEDHTTCNLRITELETQLANARQDVADRDEAAAEHRRLVRELDVALNGEGGAAEQASLCDLIGPAKAMRQAVLDIGPTLQDRLFRTRAGITDAARIADLESKLFIACEALRIFRWWAHPNDWTRQPCNEALTRIDQS